MKEKLNNIDRKYIRFVIVYTAVYTLLSQIIRVVRSRLQNR